MRPRNALLLCATLSSALGAQAPFAHNTQEFHNRILGNTELLFPNYLQTQGNGDGDALFKVVPREVLERAGEHQISGYRIGIAIDNAYTGLLPALVRLPALQLHYTQVGRLPDSKGKEYEYPDPGRKVGPRFDSLRLRLPTKGAWVVEVEFDSQNNNQNLQKLLSVPAQVQGRTQGLAMMILGEPGETRSTQVASVVLRPSFNEKHYLPGRESYSGSFDVGKKVFAMHGTQNQPSATGEVFGTLLFQNPTLNLFSDSSGGGNFAEETHMGPGAYTNDLASRRRAGYFGVFVQAEQYHAANPTHTAVPLIVARSEAGPTQSLQVAPGAVLRVHPQELQLLDLFLGAGFFGRLGTYKAKGVAGFAVDQRGSWASPRIPVPPNKALVGQWFWMQAVILDQRLNIVDVTNAVRMGVQ